MKKKREPKKITFGGVLCRNTDGELVIYENNELRHRVLTFNQSKFPEITYRTPLRTAIVTVEYC